MQTRIIRAAATACLCASCLLGPGSLVLSEPASAAVLFVDDFEVGASPAWGNQRGGWRAIDGVYDAARPSNDPLTYTSVATLPALTDHAVDVDVNSVEDGGVWLRSSFENGIITGVLLVTANDDLYWHIVTPDHQGPLFPLLNPVFVPGLSGSDIHLRIEVEGDAYRAFLDGGTTPVTSLTTDLFPTGAAGLYDFSPRTGEPAPRGQTFDNFVISTEIPEPGLLLALAGSLLALLGLRRARR